MVDSNASLSLASTARWTASARAFESAREDRLFNDPWAAALAGVEGAPWLGSLDDPEAFLANLGWQAAITQPGAPDAHYQRWSLPVIPVDMPNMPHNWYVTAHKLGG